MTKLIADPGNSLPRVTVLVATYNGGQWINEQVESILAQQGVDVRVCFSDDGSTDDTAKQLQAWSDKDERVTLLPRRPGPPGVTGNFLYLFTSVQVEDGEYVAFSDQDDVWHLDKLEREIRFLTTCGADAVSSNVTRVSSTGVSEEIIKSQPLRRWDYLFEAAGPGSTYVFTASMHAQICRALAHLDTSKIAVHDWYLYALTRALGGKWAILDQSTLNYRQHSHNVQGANVGWRAFRTRLAHLRSGFYREQFALIARHVAAVSQGRFSDAWEAELEQILSDLANPTITSRIRIATRWRHIRRKRREGLVLAIAGVLGIW